jgi:ribosomal protein S18 acetylase RimI-like enzyme
MCYPPRNANARRFYEARGFRQVGESDGSRNEEKEPDALYLWTR